MPYDFYHSTPVDDLFCGVDDQTDGWIDPIDAVRQFHAWNPEGSARRALLLMLESGAVRAKATRVVAKWGLISYRHETKSFEAFDVKLGFSSATRGQMQLDNVRLADRFWEKIFEISDNNWVKTTGFLVPTFHLADWNRGQFSRTDTTEWEWHEGIPEEYVTGWVWHSYGVRFCQTDVDAVAPPKSDDKPFTARPPKYDWEGAFAHFAALHDHIGVFDDAFSHGAQAAIESCLHDWFASRAQAPSETIVRTKARIILEAFQKLEKDKGN